MFVRLARELARAERLQERSGADRDGHRRVQGDQRHLRPPRRRRGAARGRRARCSRRCGRTTSASASPATSSSSSSPTARARRPKPSAASCRQASARSRSRSGPGASIAARRQRGRRRVPARRHDLRGAARRRRPRGCIATRRCGGETCRWRIDGADGISAPHRTSSQPAPDDEEPSRVPKRRNRRASAELQPERSRA